MNWGPIGRALDAIPYWMILWVAFVLAIMPIGQPHLIEKIRMLVHGTLHRPLDWFDLFLHGFPLLILLVKIIYDLARRS